MTKIRVPFIAFEGIDKCGKGTQSLLAANVLKSAWGDVVHFSEPNDRDSMVGRHIRKILKHEYPAPPIPDFQRLYVIDRAQDTVSTVLPALRAGIPVVAERFSLSTIAYGSLEGSTDEYVRMHEEVLGPWLRWPDVTIILDLPAEEAMRRLAREKGKPELFEKLDSLTRIRRAYLDLAEDSKRWAPDMNVIVLDADYPVLTVQEKVAAALTPYLL